MFRYCFNTLFDYETPDFSFDINSKGYHRFLILANEAHPIYISESARLTRINTLTKRGKVYNGHDAPCTVYTLYTHA